MVVLPPYLYFKGPSTWTQVFRFDKEGDKTPSLTLGTAFVPGTGHNQFCKPAAVAVESSGVFYVADG